MAGLSIAGYTAKDLDEVLSSMRAKVRARIGEDVNLTSSSVLGTLIGIFAEEVADIWKATQALYDAFNRDNASGAALDNLALLIGLRRRDGIATTAFGDMTGTGTAFIPAGSLTESSGGDRFRTLAASRVGDSGVALAAVSIGPTDPGATLTPVTVITGWTGVSVASTFLGRNVETDGELRARMEVQPEVIGSATVEAIRADLIRELPDALSVLVVENTSDTVNALGMPAHSVRAYLYPPTLPAAQIGASIWRSKPAGIATSGDESVVVVDSMGESHAIGFTFSPQFELEWRVTVTGSPTYPGDPAVKDSVKAFTDELDVNETVKPFACMCHILDEHGEDAFDSIVVEVREKGVGSYQSTPLAVDAFSIGVTEVADVTVV